MNFKNYLKIQMKLTNFIGILCDIPPTLRVTKIQHVFHNLDRKSEIYFNYRILYKIINTHVAKKMVEKKRQNRLKQVK